MLLIARRTLKLVTLLRKRQLILRFWRGHHLCDNRVVFNFLAGHGSFSFFLPALLLALLFVLQFGVVPLHEQILVEEGIVQHLLFYSNRV